MIPPLLIFKWSIKNGAEPVTAAFVSDPISKCGLGIVGFVCQSNEERFPVVVIGYKVV